MMMTTPIVHRRGEQPRERINARRIIARIAHERAKHARARQGIHAVARRRRRRCRCRCATARGVGVAMPASRAVPATTTDAAHRHRRIDAKITRRGVSAIACGGARRRRGAARCSARDARCASTKESQRDRRPTNGHAAITRIYMDIKPSRIREPHATPNRYDRA